MNADKHVEMLEKSIGYVYKNKNYGLTAQPMFFHI